jgi:CRP-like cAMP-binding protein
MKLMRIAKWHQAAPGDVLTVQGQPLESMMMIYNGRLAVEKNGKQFAELLDGNFIGEVSFISGGAATATVRAIEPTRYVAWKKTEMDALLKRNPAMRTAMQSMFSTDLSKKLSERAPSFTARLPVVLEELGRGQTEPRPSSKQQ